MVNTPAKILLALAAFAGVTAVVYGPASGDRSGTLLFVAVLVAALLAAFAVMGSAGADPLETAADEEDPAPVSFGPADVGRPSIWPLVVAVSLGLVAVGAAEGPAWVVGGGLLILVAVAGWTARVWREHPSFTPRVGARLGERLLVPSLLPLAALVVTGVIAISLSRILLAVSKDGSVAIAFVAAAVIFAACVVVAYRPRLSSSALIGLVAVGAVLAGAAGVVGAAAGEREFHPHDDHGEEIHIAAENTEFDTDSLEVPAKKTVHVTFDNHDHDIFHNVAVYRPGTEPEGVGEAVFSSRPITEGELEFELEIEEPGEYVFVCDFHPNMRGDLVAE